MVHSKIGINDFGADVLKFDLVDSIVHGYGKVSRPGGGQRLESRSLYDKTTVPMMKYFLNTS